MQVNLRRVVVRDAQPHPLAEVAAARKQRTNAPVNTGLSHRYQLRTKIDISPIFARYFTSRRSSAGRKNCNDGEEETRGLRGVETSAQRPLQITNEWIPCKS